MDRRCASSAQPRTHASAYSGFHNSLYDDLRPSCESTTLVAWGGGRTAISLHRWGSGPCPSGHPRAHERVRMQRAQGFRVRPTPEVRGSTVFNRQNRVPCRSRLLAPAASETRRAPATRSSASLTLKGPGEWVQEGAASMHTSCCRNTRIYQPGVCAMFHVKHECHPPPGLRRCTRRHEPDPSPRDREIGGTKVPSTRGLCS